MGDDPAVRVYGAARRDVLALVQTRLGREWVLLSCFEKGLSRAKSTPTIVIFVDPFTSRDWADLALQIRLRLPHDGPAALKLEVEFIPGCIIAYTSSNARNAPV
jgi:hypothetical protein